VHERSQEDTLMASNLISRLPFFRQFPAHIVRSFCEVMQYCRLPAGRIGA
jgi:hypothetical protein